MSEVLRSVPMKLALVLGCCIALSSRELRAGVIDLGQAGNYAVFAINQFAYNGPGVINGDVAVGGSTNFASPAQINGTVFLNTGVSQQGNIVPTGGFTHTNLSQAISDANSAASTLGALTPTQNLGAVGNNATINGSGGLNVVDVSGINMTSGILTLHGSASDIFVINDSGKFTSSNSAMQLTGGVTPNNVIFNVSGSVAITGGGATNFEGTILAPNSSVSVHDKTLTGELIGLNIADTSGFKVNGPTPPSVPAPSPLIACAGLVGVLGLGHIWRKRAAVVA